MAQERLYQENIDKYLLGIDQKYLIILIRKKNNLELHYDKDWDILPMFFSKHNDSFFDYYSSVYDTLSSSIPIEEHSSRLNQS